MCDPSTITEDDSIKGKWVRVGPDLNQETSMTYLVSLLSRSPRIPRSVILHQNIYYRRTRRLDVPLITELKLLPEGEEPTPMSDAWYKVQKSTRASSAGLAPLFLWYKAEKTAQEMTNAEKQNDLITELDVTYGEDVPWYGFEKLSPPTTPEIKNRRQSAYITFRRGVKRTSPYITGANIALKRSARSPTRISPTFLQRREIPHPSGRRLTLFCFPRRMPQHHHLPVRGFRQPHFHPPRESSRC